MNRRIIKFILVLSLTIVFEWSNAQNSTSTSICNVADSFEHLIITSTELASDTGAYSLAALRNYRIAKGMSSTIVLTEDIYRNYIGVDNAEKIRNFIRDAKQNWESKYVLLAGDTKHVPARMFFSRGVYLASDMYFGCLDSTFNNNGNEKWGESSDGLDFEYDINVGRASAETNEEMSNFVYKTITYENSPINASYHTKMFQWNQDATGIGNTSKWPGRFTEKSKELSVEYYRMIDGVADVVTNRRLGSHNIGWYVGASHGYVAKMANITNAEAEKLENGDQFYFMTSIACLVGKFDEDCFAEHICTSTRKGGAFAGMFNSHNAFPPYIVQYIYSLRDYHLVDSITQLGPLRSAIANTFPLNTYQGNEELNSARRYQAYQFNLFGDPATEWKLVNSKPIDVNLNFNSLDENTFKDESSNNNHAMAFNGADTTASLFGKALYCDGKDDYLKCLHSDWNPLGDQMELSISSWIRVDSIVENAGLFVKGIDKKPFAIKLTSEGKINFSLNQNNPLNGIGIGEWSSVKSLTPHCWYHIAIVINYETAQLRFYIDGELDRTVALPVNWLIGYTQEPLFIGVNINGADSIFFSGAIDELRIYSRDLDQKEIKEAMLASKTHCIQSIQIVNPGEYPDNLNEYIFYSDEIVKDSFSVLANISNPMSFNGSIEFKCGGLTSIDNNAEFICSENSSNELNTLLNEVGKHRLEINLYTEQNCAGFMLDSRIIDIEIVKGSRVSTNKQFNKNDIFIYPTERYNNFNLHSNKTFENVRLNISGLSGAVFHQETISFSGKHPVSLETYPPGFYVISLEAENLSFSSKVITR